jgi:hypothetical protein
MAHSDALFDVLGLEQELYSDAITAAHKAKTTSGTLRHLAMAIEHGFTVIEHVSALRAVDAPRADELSETWRSTLQDVIAAQCHVAEVRRAELDSTLQPPDS